MQRPPPNQKTPIFDFAMFIRSSPVSMIMPAGSYWVFFCEQRSGASIAQTRTAVVNVVVAVASTFLISYRSLRRSIFSIGLTVVVQLLFTYALMMNRFLHNAPIDASVGLCILGVAARAFMLVEMEKKICCSR